MQVFFRLLRLNKLQMVTLSRQIAELQVTDLVTHYEVAVPLSAILLEDLMMFVVRQQVTLEDCDILLQIAAPADIQAVPASVNQLLKHLDCRLSVQSVATLNTSPVEPVVIA